MAKKSIKNLSKSSLDDIEERKEKGINQGIAQKPIDEALPTYESVPSEHVIKSDNNSFIILGRDRPSIPISGNGGKGTTQSSRVDLIAGLAATYRHKDGEITPPDSDTMVNPSFCTDAARIYITQKGNMDEYMGLSLGPYDESTNRSGIGLKSDVIRLHARTDIKLVSGRGKFEGLDSSGERLSTGGANEVVGTISFIAGNYTESSNLMDFSFFDPTGKGKASKVRKLQPIPKGDNLSLALSDIIDKLKELNSRVGSNSKLINKLNNSMMRHTHISPVGPTSNALSHAGAYVKIGSQSFKDFKNKAIFAKDADLLKVNYLNPSAGGRFINSKFVFTT